MNAFNPSRRFFLKGAVATAALVPVAAPGFAKVTPAPDPFIEKLIKSLTVEEKAGQLSLYGDSTRFDGAPINPTSEQAQTKEKVKADIAAGKITGLFNGIGVAGGRELQQVAIEQSRSKIPLIFGGDIIHGLKTTFPIPLGESASFDTDLAMRTARASALEATAKGIHWTFAPMVDVARDQRWGRVAEGSGEDTWLGIQLAIARVKGFQGNNLKDDRTMLACPKHFAAYGAVQGGMEYNTVDIPETTLREVHLPPFKAAFDAGAITTMSSFNDIAGVPSTGNHYLLTDILRGEWGFKGLVVSDYTSEEELILHGYAADGADATAKSLNAGCDVSMQSGLYIKYLPELVKSGKVKMATLDEAVRRVLYVKKALGLFDNPYRSLDLGREQTDVRRADTIALAREAGRKSCVLLKNEGNLLPLPKTGKTVALIGPFVNDKENCPGPWAVFPDVASCVPLEPAFRAVLGDRLTVVKGSDVEAPIDGGIAAAVKAAQAADIVVLAIGEAGNMSGEAQSRVDISVPAPQLALAEAVAATGKPVVVLLKHGRAIALTGAVRNAQTILCTWFLGSEEGHSVADLVFGDFAPQGRLPVSFPQASGQEPFYYNHRITGRPQITDDKNFKSRYREVTNEALYPFGHGLTYSTLSYGATAVSTATLTLTGSIQVTATVTNTGARRAHEVAQLYIHDKVASMTQPIRALKGIKHLDLEPGQSATVTFELTAADLAFVHPNLKTAAEAGRFDVWVAPSATGGTPATFELKA
ncbi:glycoside hydrolase family 3 N-terminal domain-containing protein [Asticcacaulis sp. 201]|uniref:glycoside hydrolase family 3 N-terminal domain-containing protein n=1 Tax=Asticcacaulis sp. 201 TaxID=3028787 RepID=UPI002915F1F0|nr:glycoside hydrolase family 3 N-terminal domain-containing protein [Asticcacaulis sp. 201]MDV6330241.1 glycoside hydrolase family 3 N-terminal domain-containing protein [Asticcacaulis sp. 201]